MSGASRIYVKELSFPDETVEVRVHFLALRDFLFEYSYSSLRTRRSSILSGIRELTIPWQCI